MISLVLGDDTLELTPANGYNIVAFDMGYPSPRNVLYPRANANGEVDRTSFFGERAVSLGIRTTGDRWERIRELSPYMVPSARPYLVHTYESEPRRMTVRAAGMNYGLSAAPYQDFMLQWVAPNGSWETVAERSVTVLPFITSDEGFGFDVGFDLSFPPLTNPLSVNAFTDGNVGCPPVIDIYGPCSNPFLLSFRDLDASGLPKRLQFDIALSATQFLTVNTRERTVLLNGTTNRYNTLSPISTWFTLLEGNNPLRFQAESSSGNARAVVRYRCQYL